MVDQITERFLKNLGHVKVLSREEEYRLFRSLNFYTIVSYRLMRVLGMTDANNDGPYNVSVTLTERRYGEVGRAIGYVANDRRTFSNKLQVSLNMVNVIVQVLIRHNLRLIMSIIKRRFLQGTLTMMDLLNEGIISLKKTFWRFDYTKGHKFSTYCIHWIQQGIYRLLNQGNRAVHFPIHVSGSLRKGSQLFELLSRGEALSLTQRRHLKRIALLPRHKISLETFTEEDGPSIQDSLVGSSADDMETLTVQSLFRSSVIRSIRRLPWRQARLVRMRLNLSWSTDEEIALSSRLLRPELELGLVRLTAWLDLNRVDDREDI